MIDDNQFSFLGGRNMLDNVVVLNKVLHAARKLKKPTLVFKVDYEMTYDSVSWTFLAYMMRRVLFSERWIKWIMSCLGSTSMSVLVYGSPCEELRMGKGLRQGDPLAPFLFLIVAQGLNGFFSKAVNLDRFHGFTFGEDLGIDISMLQLSYDTIFVGDASIQNVQTLKCVLRCFELVSGLKVNFHKRNVAGVAVAGGCLRQFAAVLY